MTRVGEAVPTASPAPLATGARGVLHGSLSAVLMDEEGQILEAHSVSAGLDYPGFGPEHAHLRDRGRVRYVAVSDDDALAAFRRTCELEGIVLKDRTAPYRSGSRKGWSKLKAPDWHEKHRERFIE